MKWSDKWQLPFNIVKCKILHLGTNNPRNEYSLSLNNTRMVLEEVEKEIDLGITFDGNLQFTQHVVTCSVKARQRIGLIRRSFKCINDQIFILLYKLLVRPILEYANTVWAPAYEKDSEGLERVQRRATKLVPRLKHMSYPTRLADIDIQTKKSRYDTSL